MREIVIKNKYQEVTLLDVGASLHKWLAYSDKRNIVITNKNVSDYFDKNDGYLSTTVGRVANRIKDGKFNLNGTLYQLNTSFDGVNHCHGGPNGFFKKVFDVVEVSDAKVVFKYVSKDMEEGYPGALTLYVTYELNDNNMTITYDATTDKDTIINITNHTYFNLSNENDILNHHLKASVSGFLETDEGLVPTGKVIDVKNTVYDLNNECVLKDIVLLDELQRKSLGLDHAFLFKKDKKEVVLSYQNHSLKIVTSYPGIQIYSGNNPIRQELLNRKYVKHFGIAMEPQYEPNAINIPSFNSMILKKNDNYHETISYTLIEK
ncbi:MAG: aldose epimerase family protein [Acholeplasma sp.]|nr:aldose epimerase family protein [Acholeplasma sp.]